MIRLALVAVVLLLTAGCGEDPPTQARGEPAPPTCPDVLSDEGRSSDPAETAPGLRLPSRAWVCRYDPGDADWTLVGDRVEVSGEPLAAIADGLAALEPADPGRMCTQELGPRWLVLWGDGSGAVVEGYGCRDVRLTDDVGVLSGPAGLLDAIVAAYDG